MLTFFMQTVTISQQLLQTQDIHQVQVGRKKWVCYIKLDSWKLCETRCLPPRGAQSSQVNILNHSRACQTAVARCLLRSCNVSGAPARSKVTPSPPGPPQQRNWNASQQQRRFTGQTSLESNWHWKMGNTWLQKSTVSITSPLWFWWVFPSPAQRT